MDVAKIGKIDLFSQIIFHELWHLWFTYLPGQMEVGKLVFTADPGGLPCIHLSMSKLRPPSLYPQVSRSFVSVPLYCDPAQWWRPPLPRWMSVSVRWWPPGKSFRASAGHLSSLDCALFTSNIARISRHCHHGLFQTFLYLQQSTNNFLTLW